MVSRVFLTGSILAVAGLAACAPIKDVRGYVPDDTPFVENVFVWLCRLYSVYTAAEERLSAQLAAVEMLKSGTTTFLEAGTIRFLDEVVDGLVEVGIRGRIGRWVWDLPPEPDVYRQTTDQAIAHLQQQLTELRSVARSRAVRPLSSSRSSSTTVTVRLRSFLSRTIRTGTDVPGFVRTTIPTS